MESVAPSYSIKTIFSFKSKKSTQVTKIKGGDQRSDDVNRPDFSSISYLLGLLFKGIKNVGVLKKIKSKRHRQKEIVSPFFFLIPPPPSTRRKKK
jgi:hypothetical protein